MSEIAVRIAGADELPLVLDIDDDAKAWVKKWLTEKHGVKLAN